MVVLDPGMIEGAKVALGLQVAMFQLLRSVSERLDRLALKSLSIYEATCMVPLLE